MIKDIKIAKRYARAMFDIASEDQSYDDWLNKLKLISDTRVEVNFANALNSTKLSFSKKIKSSVKSAVKHINNFEETAAEIAILNGYDYVICGHIHQPVIKKLTTHKGTITYLNSGDWVENLTSLEYNQGEWTIYDYHNDPLFLDDPKDEIAEEDLIDLKTTEVFDLLKQAMELPN